MVRSDRSIFEWAKGNDIFDIEVVLFTNAEFKRQDFTGPRQFYN